MATIERTVSPEMLTTTQKEIYKVVLTGGPCAGKTTALARFRTFFESLGWKVYCVPESATLLLGGGVDVAKLNQKQIHSFHENILKTIMQVEKTFFDLASEDEKNCLIVCDRGTMDPSAFCSAEKWEDILKENGLDTYIIRDNRYDQIVHLETAAKGAESFYQLSNNNTRTEGLQLARERDEKAAQAWVGHPYCDVIDNSTDFDGKIRRAIEVVCRRLGGRLGVNVHDRLKAMSKKRKFLVKSLPSIDEFPPYQDFEVQHDYLQVCNNSEMQPRIRKRGQKSNFMYTLTERKMVNNEKVEVIKQIKRREYEEMLLKQRHPSHRSVHKTRRCFHWQDHYYQLDIFKEPCTLKCANLLLLETYTTCIGSDLKLPSFLDIIKEVTDIPDYSMFNLSIDSK